MTKAEKLEETLGQRMKALALKERSENRKLQSMSCANYDQLKAQAQRGGRPRYGESRTQARKRRGLD